MFYAEPEQKYVDVAEQLLEVRSRLMFDFESDEPGLYSSMHPKCEETYSCVMSAVLQRNLGDEARNWYHQLPVPTRTHQHASADTVLYASLDSSSPLGQCDLPCAVFEYGWKASGSKKSQVSAYAVHLSKTLSDATLKHGLAFASVESLMDKAGQDVISFHVHGFAPISADDEKFSTMTVWVGEVEQLTLARVLAAGCHFPVLVKHAVEKEMNWVRYGPNLAVQDEEIVYKIYDYRTCVRDGIVPLSERRTHKYYEHLPGGKLLDPKNDEDLKIVRYAFIKGEHAASCVEHFRSAAEILKSSLHDHDLCHGDIRLANMLFTKDGKGHLIDFDLTGKLDNARYPDGYVLDLADSSRHEDAKSGAPLKVEHDWFSFAACMELHRTEEPFQGLWNNFVELVRNQQVDEFRSESEKYGSQSICLREDIRSSLTATGSPTRKPLRKRNSAANINSPRKRRSG